MPRLNSKIATLARFWQSADTLIYVVICPPRTRKKQRLRLPSINGFVEINGFGSLRTCRRESRRRLAHANFNRLLLNRKCEGVPAIRKSNLWPPSGVLTALGPRSQ